MFVFKVIPDDGETFTVKAGSRDVAAWERASRKSLSDLLTTPNFVDYYRLAHLAGRRLGLVSVDLPNFEKTVELRLTEVEDEPDPTQPAP